MTSSQNRSSRDKHRRHDLTEYGTSIICLFVSVFFVFCALYLGPYPNPTILDFTVPVGSVVRWGCYILAAVCFVFFLGFWGVAMRNSPEMRTFFRSIWGGGEQGWQYSAQTVFFLVFAFFVHLVATLLFYLSHRFGWLFWLEYVGWLVQVIVAIFLLFASVMLGYACDAFFIKPVLESTSKGGKAFQSLVDNVRKRAIVIVPILIALITLFVEVFGKP